MLAPNSKDIKKPEDVLGFKWDNEADEKKAKVSSMKPDEVEKFRQEMIKKYKQK